MRPTIVVFAGPDRRARPPVPGLPRLGGRDFFVSVTPCDEYPILSGWETFGRPSIVLCGPIDVKQ